MKEIDAAIEALESCRIIRICEDADVPDKEVTPRIITEALAGLRSLTAKQGEPDTRCKIKLGSQYGSDLAGHWFFLRPADEHAEAALAKHSGITLPAPEAKQEPT